MILFKHYEISNLMIIIKRNDIKVRNLISEVGFSLIFRSPDCTLDLLMNL